VIVNIEMSKLDDPGNGKSMCKQISGAAKPLEIQVLKPVLLSGPVLKFIPCVARILGGDLQGIVFHQLSYLSRDMSVGMGLEKGRRISLTRLQRQLPFVGRRRLIQVLQDLEGHGCFKVERTRRVNVYFPLITIDTLLKAAADPSESPAFLSNYIVIPTLAEKIGLKNAIVLQQIHLRTHGEEGSNFVIRSLEQWQAQTLPFWGIATIKRIFAKLRALNLVIVRPYRREDDGIVNSYRLNYIGLAELLSLPMPQVKNPYEQNPKNWWDKQQWQGWTNPVTLIMQSELK
jgi:hypothetical protein